jgi:hypothetical protein
MGPLVAMLDAIEGDMAAADAGNVRMRAAASDI